jgi:hypothetical protein
VRSRSAGRNQEEGLWKGLTVEESEGHACLIELQNEQPIDFKLTTEPAHSVHSPFHRDDSQSSFQLLQTVSECQT